MTARSEMRSVEAVKEQQEVAGAGGLGRLAAVVVAATAQFGMAAAAALVVGRSAVEEVDFETGSP